MTDVPNWAINKARTLVRAEYGDSPVVAMYYNGDPTAFARYIAEHEEEPVDPLLIEAREICAKSCENVTVPAGGMDPATLYRGGDMDRTANLQNVLIALRRGIELARTKSEAGE